MSNEEMAIVGEEGPMIWRAGKKAEEKQQGKKKR